VYALLGESKKKHRNLSFLPEPPKCQQLNGFNVTPFSSRAFTRSQQGNSRNGAMDARNQLKFPWKAII
jgi:hypothetical protein